MRFVIRYAAFFFLFTTLSLFLTTACENPAEGGGTVSSNTFTIKNTDEWNSATDAVKNGGDNRSYTLVINGTVGVPGTDGSGPTLTAIIP
ncbi:MAG: hypothetical protein LBP80_07760, partial [Treponema sp.]|jgi:hypothetical protein|nr:hypothetical protein [Treponema sp.]